MTSKLTRERVVALIAEHSYDSALVDALEHLLAAMDSEPAAWQIHTPETGVTYVETNSQSVENIRNGFGIKVEITSLYRHAQPVVQPMMFIDGDISSEDADKLAKVIREFNEEDERPLAKMARMIRENPHPTNECDMPKAQPAPDREQVRREHAEWSQATFGDVGPIGPLKHLSKEALEAAAEPDDLSEWADMQFLMWDAQRRAGITDEQITQAMIEKLAVNKLRDYPEPKDGEPRLHIKEQPALVGPEDIPDSVYEILCQACGGKAWMYEEALWNACRAAMLLAGNSPVIPEGYVMVPKEPTKEMIAAAMNCDDVLFNSDESFCVQFGNIYEAMLAAATQEVK